MTQTTAAAPLIGRCVVCRRTYRAASEVQVRAIGGCECRKGVQCSDWSHQHGMPGGVPGADHPATAIRWRPVKVTVTAQAHLPLRACSRGTLPPSAPRRLPPPPPSPRCRPRPTTR